MASLNDRRSDGSGIAKASQIIAVTAPETEAASAAATEGRTFLSVETSHHGVALVTRGAAAPVPATTRDGMMNAASIVEVLR